MPVKTGASGEPHRPDVVNPTDTSGVATATLP
jgi:hypothetical protein